MPKTNRIILWLIGIALLGGVAWYTHWFLTNFEEVSKEVRTGISPEARKNRFLAAEMFLAQNSQNVTSKAGSNIFALNPSTEDTILIGSHSQLFLKHNNDKLVDWVKGGGHLILVPETTDDNEEEQSSLIQTLGVELHFVNEDEQTDMPCGEEESSCDDKTASADNACGESDQPCEDETGSAEGEKNSAPTHTQENPDKEKKTDDDKWVTVSFHTDYPGDFQASFLSDRYLKDTQDSASVIVGNGDHFNLLEYTLGDGTVTVLSDLSLFTNADIGKHDHAYLLYQLMAGPGKAWIFYSADMPSLLALLWKKAPYLTMLSLFLLMMAGWRMLMRSGPRLKPQYEDRRNLLEHIDATAIYSWRIDKAHQLFSDNRKAIEQAWRRRHPQLGNMTQNERCQWIGEKTGISASAVERTLYSEIANEQDFIRASAVMQQLAAIINQRAGPELAD